MMNSNIFKIICLGSFLTSFSYGIMLILPIYIVDYLQHPITISGKIISLGIVGVISSILLIPFLSKFLKTNIMASLGSLVYFFAIFLLLTKNLNLMYFSGLLLGAGWGIIYTMGPIMVSSSSSQKSLSKNFMFISAFNMLGAGISPVLVNIFLKNNFSIFLIFTIAALISLSASIIFFTMKVEGLTHKHPQGIFFFLRKVFTTKAIIPCIMVLLGACIFSTMMNFQSIIAKEKSLDFSVFYISYTLTLLFARFYLTDTIVKLPRYHSIPLLLGIMTISLLIFIFVNNNLIYIIPSSLLGLSYGLVYPLIQTEMVTEVDSTEKSGYLTVFSLSYFIGVFGYPYFFTSFLSNSGIVISLTILIFISLLELLISLFIKKDSVVVK